MKNTRHARGVSPVIGVILMIALAVILAAVISQFTLELQGLLQEPIQAGVTFQEEYDANEDEYTVEIIWSSEGTVEKLHAIEPDGSTTAPINEIGQSITINGASEGDTIRVIGTMDDGSKGVIQEHQVGG